MNSLISLAKLPELVDFGPLEPALDMLFGPLLEYIDVADFIESEESGIHSITLVLGIKQTVLFQVPGLSAIQLGIVSDNPDEWPLILFELQLEGPAPHIAIRHFPLRVVIDNPYLKPIGEEDAADLLPGFSFEVEGSFSVSTDLAIKAELDSFTLPLFLIEGLNIALGLEECRLITHADDVGEELSELGFDSDFRGIHALSAQFYWDIPFLLDGAEIPGLRAELENLALGNQGISVTANLSWEVAFDGDHINAAQTELHGELFESGWHFAFASLDVELQRNIPIATSATGYLLIPFFSQLVKLELGYEYESPERYQLAMQIRQQTEQGILLTLGADNHILQIKDFHLSGQFSSDGVFSLAGSGKIHLQLPGISVTSEDIGIAFEHTLEQDNLLVELTNVQLEHYGQLDSAQLVIVMLNDAEDEYQLALVELVAEVQWQDLSSRISLDNNLPLLPMPPDDALVSLNVSWSNDTFNLAVKAALEDADAMWRFIPEAMRPEVSEANIDIQLTASGIGFIGDLGIEFLLRLPDIAELGALQIAGLSDFIELDAGDEDGWIDVRFSADLDNADGDSAVSLTASIGNPISIGLQLPGLLMAEPPIFIEIDNIGLTLDSEGQDISGEIKLSGGFELHPILPADLAGFVPPQIAVQLDSLLAIARQIDLSGDANLVIGISDDNAYFKADCNFEQAALELDLFDMLANSMAGKTNLFGDGSGNEIDIDIDVSVQLEKLYLQIGSEQAQQSQTLPFTVGFGASLNFAGIVDFPFAFELTQEQLSFGLTELRIPIAIPQLPMSLADLDLLKDGTDSWDIQNKWLPTLLPELVFQINELSGLLDDANTILDELRLHPEDNQAALFQQQYRIIPAYQKALFDLVGRKFLYEAIVFVHQNIHANSQAQYQQYVEMYQGSVDAALGWISVDTQLSFDIADALFVLPFSNPADIRVEGSASIGGVDPDSMLAPLADLQLTLGISADAIYFAVQGGADPIPLPDFGRYPGSAVNFDKLIIGYGYNKNSLKIDFAGELILSEKLIDDADTSAELGFGVLLPNNSKVRFKLDLIPITLGEIDFLLPLIDFGLDLRSDIPPLAAAQDGQCNPAWDGLQLIVPDVFRADLKNLRYSMFFGPVPAVNGEYAFDVDIGNEKIGIRHICDYQYISPIAGVLPIPFLMDNSLFFNRLCSNIRIGGFALSFDLTRPFPHPSPLLVFELLGFISDPDSSIDPNGHIADLMYAELYHARVELPQSVVAMFPGLGAVVDTDYSGRINVATVIAVGQNIQKWLTYITEKIAANGQRSFTWVESIIEDPPVLEVTDLLSLLPLEMRTVRLQGKLVNFDADALFVMALASDLEKQLGGTETPSAPELELIYRNDFSVSDLDEWQAYDYGLKRGKGEWSVDRGELVQHNNVGDNSPARYGAVLVCKNIELASGQITVNALSFDDDGMGLVFHVQGKDTYYRFRMTAEQKQWRLDKLIKGDITTLHENSDTFMPGKVYQLKVDVRSQMISPSASALSNSSAISRRTAGQRQAKKKPSEAYVTHIKVWVNGGLWCSVTDDKKPLTSGHVGVDSWWNQGTRFDDLIVHEYRKAQFSLENGIEPNQLVSLNARLTQTSEEMSDLFTGFSAQDIATAMSQGSEFSLAMRATVRLSEQYLLDMIGSIDDQGRFHLLSSVGVNPFDLEVAGLHFPMQLQAASRLVLSGQSAGANSYVRLSAELFADWIIMPGSNPDSARVRLLIGTAKEPVSFEMTSERQFSLVGRGELQLFSQQLLVSGELDISQNHVMIAGDLLFEPEFEVANRKVFGINAAVKAHLGPGDFVQISGSGQVHLFEKAFMATDMQIANDKLALRLTSGFSGDDSIWSVGDFPLKNAQVAVEGSVDFSQSQPLLAIHGQASFELFNAKMRGNVQIESQGSSWLLAAEGKMFWLGRNWLDGSMQLSNSGLQVEGRADFSVPLTATQLGGGMQIAGLYFNLVVSGKFTLNSQGQLLSWALDVDWQLAVKLPGSSGDDQSLPVAMQQLHIEGTHAATNQAFKLAHLVDFSGFTLFDFEGITVPVPVPDFSQTENFYLAIESLTFSGPNVMLPVVTLQATNSQGVANEVVPLTPLFIEQQGIQVPDISIDVPTITTNSNGSPLFSLPTFATHQVSIGKFALDDQFTLALAWKEDQLGVIVKVGQDENFHAFESIVQQLIGVISFTFPSP